MEGIVLVNASIIATDDSLLLEIMRSDDVEIELCETDVIKACGSISDPSLIMTDDDGDDRSSLTSLILLSIMVLLSMLILLSVIITLVVVVTELANDDLSEGS